MKKTIIVLFMISLFTGCSALETFFNRPVVEDQLITDKRLVNDNNPGQEIGTLSVTAQRRLVVGNLRTGNFCSEPPPDIADSVTTAIAATLDANITEDKNANAELASNFARHVNQIYKRAHTVQLFRDASYHLCVNAVNSANDNYEGSVGYESYKDAIRGMVTEMLPTLNLEVAAYYDVEKERAKNPPDISQETILCNSTAGVGKQTGDTENTLTTSINCRPLNMKIEKELTKRD